MVTDDQRSELIAAIEAIPDHNMGGYECEWDCEGRYGSKFPNCTSDEPDHQHELISRERVLTIARSTSVAEDRLKPTAAGSTPATGRCDDSLALALRDWMVTTSRQAEDDLRDAAETWLEARDA